MDNDCERPDDLERINAFVDGELAAPARAAVAARIAASPDYARAHATLARLKGCVAALAEESTTLAVRARRSWHVRWRIRPITAAAAAAAAVLFAVGFVTIGPPPHRQPSTALIAGVAVPFAGMTALVPDLGAAGLRLTGLAMETQATPTPTLVATYRGPRGCRVELRVRAAEGPVAPVDLPNRRVWAGDGLAYDMEAFGMPAQRFALIASAARIATLDSPGRDRLARTLHAARAEAPPCRA